MNKQSIGPILRLILFSALSVVWKISFAASPCTSWSTITAPYQVHADPIQSTTPRDQGTPLSLESNEITPWTSEDVGVLDAKGCAVYEGISTWFDAYDVPTGYTYQGHDIFPTEHPGIGYIIEAKDPNQPAVNIGAVPALLYSRVYNTPNFDFYIGVNSRIRFIAIGNINAGSYYIAPRVVGKAILSDGLTTIRNEMASFETSYPGFILTFNAATCSIEPSSQNQIVTMPTVDTSQFKGVGSTVGSKNFDTTVDCAEGISLYATLTDSTTPTNYTDTLTLSPSSTAKGIGLNISNSTGPISFGPASSSKGNLNQWFIVGGPGSSAALYTFSLTANYVQTSAVMEPGSVNAISTITLSYQ